MVRVETRDRSLCCVPSFNWSNLFMAEIQRIWSFFGGTNNARSFFSVFSFVGLHFSPYRGLREEIFFFTDYESPVDSGQKPFALILSESVTRHTQRQTGLSNLQFLKKGQLKWFFFLTPVPTKHLTEHSCFFSLLRLGEFIIFRW